MKAFDTYKEAFKYAQNKANKIGVSYGIEKIKNTLLWNGKKYKVKMLPKPENRSGHELRMQAVEPMKKV